MNQIVSLINAQPLSQADREFIAQANLPLLKKMTRRADSYRVKSSDFYARTSHWFHQPAPLPVAPLLSQALLVDADPKAFWLLVSPVNLLADRDTLVLIPPVDLGLQETEAQALLSAFNQHFFQDGVQLEWGDLNHWFIRLPQSIDIQTTPLNSAAYRSLQDQFPRGHAAQYWRKLMNECQMLFFNHPVNQARREQGRPEINSVWLWGEGQLNADQIKLRADTKMYAQWPYLKGMANLTQAQFSSVPANHQAWLSASEQAQSHVLVLERPSNQTEEALMHWFKQLEQDWLQGLMNDLKVGRISSLLLDLGFSRAFHLQPRHLKRFWRWGNALRYHD